MSRRLSTDTLQAVRRVTSVPQNTLGMIRLHRGCETCVAILKSRFLNAVTCMKALTLTAIKAPLELLDHPEPTPGPEQVVVRLKAAAVNRRDYWITQGLYPGISPPVILGSDGAGIVERTGSSVGNYWKERDVIINPGLNWGDDNAFQSPEFSILGLPSNGTFADEVVVNASQLHPKPAHLDWEHSAALPLAGVTAYRALFTQGNLKSGQRVLISGIGGGVASFALQFAVAAGAEVWVTSSSPKKIQRASDLGAAGGFLYTETDWTKQMAAGPGSPHLIIDSAAGKGYRSLIEIAAPGGRIVNYGATAGPPEKLDLFKVFWKQIRLQGSTMGSPQDFTEMLKFVDDKKIAPIVDQVFPLHQGDQAIASMHRSPQFGKLLLSME